MITLNNEQMHLLKNKFQLIYSNSNNDYIQTLMDDFLKTVDPILLVNLDEYLHDKPLSNINIAKINENTFITLHDILVHYTNYDSDQEAYKSSRTINAFKMLSKFYRKESSFIALWSYYGPWPC